MKALHGANDAVTVELLTLKTIAPRFPSLSGVKWGRGHYA